MILDVQQNWACPNCPATAVTVGAANRFHRCAGMNGFLAPMVIAGVKCKVVAELRGDYVAGEDIPLDDEGRPIMAVRTVRDDGEDVAVYAPTAHASMRS